MAKFSSTVLVLSGSLILGAMGCDDEAITYAAPTCDPGTAETAAGTTGEPAAAGTTGMTTAGTTGMTTAGTTGMATAGTTGMTTAGTGGTEAAASGGMMTTDMSPATDGTAMMEGGTTEEMPMEEAASTLPEPAPCPDAFTCSDPLEFLTAIDTQATAVTDDGQTVPFTCSPDNSVGTTCDPADPAGSCPMFTKPFCINVSIVGMNLVQCSQACTP